nr:hypothetical protein [Candidatus Sigynarchaeota archaeon]
MEPFYAWQSRYAVSTRDSPVRLDVANLGASMTGARLQVPSTGESSPVTEKESKQGPRRPRQLGIIDAICRALLA